MHPCQMWVSGVDSGSVLLQVDMLSEINIAPRILTNFTGVMPSQFKKDLDSYLKTRSPVTFLSELRSNLQVGGPSSGWRCGDGRWSCGLTAFSWLLGVQ